MKKTLSLLLIIIFSLVSFTVNSAPLKDKSEILLWTKIAPGSEGVKIEETVTDSSKDPADPQRTFKGISKPSMFAYLPKNPSGVAALIFAGGGYTSIVIDKEGTDIAKWLNSFGVTAFVLKFRLPGEGHNDGKNVPLADAQRALKIITANAKDWGIDPAKIGLVGLSSGGHFSAMVAMNYDKNVYKAQDKIDSTIIKPAFLVSAYGPMSSNARKYLVNPEQKPVEPKEKQELYDEYPVDQQVRADSPKTFMVHGFDDKKVDVENSVRLFLALKKKGIPADLHIFQEGVHGFAIRNAKGPVKNWTNLCKEWMEAIGLFNKEEVKK